jgi:hypothetical protein
MKLKLNELSPSSWLTKAVSGPLVVSLMVVGLLSPLGALAQSNAEVSSGAAPMVTPGPSPESRRERFAGGEMTQKMHDRHAAQFEKKQAELKKQLNLTPAQEPLWDSFIQSVHPMALAKPPVDRAQMRELTQLPAPQRAQKMMDLHEARHEEMLSQMRTRLEAMKVFYAQLSTEQQKTFDQLTLRHHRQMMHARRVMHPPL